MGESADYHTLSLDALAVGTSIGGYSIRRMIGHGGFGITYEAHNRVTGKAVAIKEFFPSSMVRRDGESRLIYSTANAETIGWALRKFEETTTALCGLSHPNIVQVLDYVPANDTGYMIMELLDGHTLKDWLKARPAAPSLDELLPLVDPVMRALTYVHESGLIHRDIAPDNILITTGGRPVLIDFGSASRDLSDAQQRALSGTVGLSKRFYTAPEQMLPKARPTPEADVYSMGAVLYRALAGAEPADGQERKDCLFQGDPDPYEPLAGRPPRGCTAEAVAAIDKALALRPDARLHKMAELCDALSPPRAPDPALLQTTLVRQAIPVPVTSLPPMGRPASGSKLVRLLVGAAIVLAVVGGVIGGRLTADRGGMDRPRVAQESAAPQTPDRQGTLDQSPVTPDRSRVDPSTPPSAATTPSTPPASPPAAATPSTAPTSPPASTTPSTPPASPPAAAPSTPPASPPAAAAPSGTPPATSVAATPPGTQSAPPATAAPVQASAPGSVVRDCPNCPEVVILPPGAFTMGSGTTPYDRPPHRVEIAKPFAIGRAEVTFSDWNACVAEGGCKYKPEDQGFGGDDRPVINVSWFDAKDYLAWLSKKTGQTYRLPSEAEWEYAARGATTTAFSWGNDLGRNRANCSDCGSEDGGRETAPTKSFAPNGYGLFDMAGNAAEWVEDCWNASYRGAPKDASPRETGSCGQRVLRGGSFDTTAAYVKPTARFRYDADVRYWANGFRVLRETP